MTAKKVEQPGRDNRPWTSKELQRLRTLAHLGARAAAAALGRSVPSVRQAAHRHRISLRRTGSTAGLVLGQPRGESWVDARDIGHHVATTRRVRAAVLAGETDPAQLERIARRTARIAAGAPLCPRCARNPQEKASGYCTDCHYLELADGHRAARAHREAQRELWREKQAAKRRRDRTEGDPDDT